MRYYRDRRGGYDFDALRWGVTVSASPAQTLRVSRLVESLKLRNLWSSLDCLWLFAAETSTQALTDIVGRRVAVNNSATFTAMRGYAGNGTSAYVDLAVAASALTKYTQNSAHIGFYVQSGDGLTNLNIGARDSGSGFSSDLTSGTTTTGTFQLQSAGTATSFTQGGQSGLHIVDRQSSTVGSWARNGADTDADKTVTTSSSRATSNLTALARNSSGTYSNYSGSRLSMVCFGASLGAAGRTSFSAAVNDYMRSIGANTY